MAAVDALLERLRSLDRAVDALSEPNFKEAVIQEHLSRGIAVNGLICIETFFMERIAEWTAEIGVARVSPQSLPGGTKKYEDRIVEVLSRSLRDYDASQRSQLLEEVGRSLTSLSSGVLVPHALAFMWPGSNLQVGDIESIVAMVGIDRNRVWQELTAVWSRIDDQFPGNTSLKVVFEDVAELRHTGAHSLVLKAPVPNLATVSRNAKLICLCVDIVVSRRLRLIYGGSGKTLMPQVSVRKIVQDGKEWPEYPPGKSNAYRRHPTREIAMQAAIGRARSSGDVILVFDRGGTLLDWRTIVL